jgi:hypothetical protein
MRGGSSLAIAVAACLGAWLVGAHALRTPRTAATTRARAASDATALPDPRSDESTAVREALERAVRWLRQRQKADGSFRSELYAVLRSGQAMTPFVADTLGRVPGARTASLERARRFIRSTIGSDGAVGFADADILEYPVFATAYAVMALAQSKDAGDEERVQSMATWLEGRQIAAARGFDASSPAFGGWPFGARTPAGSPGHVDLAHTRRALEALRAAGRRGSASRAAAQRFLALLQRQPGEASRQPLIPGIRAAAGAPLFDGGFYFSPVVAAANKALVASEGGGAAYYRSYATATCDGVLALLAIGKDTRDPEVVSARAWLEENSALEHVAGVPEEHPERWSDAVLFYHLAVRAEAASALGLGGEWRARIRDTLSARQRPDGSFVNTRSAAMKENCPLLATTLAVRALAATIAGERPSLDH